MENEIKKYINTLKDGTKKMFKEFFKKDTNKKQRANMWTFIRLLIPFITLTLSIIAIITGSIPLFTISGSLAGFGAVTDYFDGKSSRKHNSTSEYGKLLDQVSDKFFAGIIGINLLFLNPSYIAILLGEGLIAGVNVYNVLKHKGIKSNSSKLGKIKEWPLFITLALGFFSPISKAWLTISNISVIITFIVQLLTAKDYTNIYKENLKKLEKEKKSDSVKNEETDPNQKELEKELLPVSDTKSKTVNDQKTRKEQLVRLRDVLKQILEIQKSNESDESTLINEEFQKKLK